MRKCLLSLLLVLLPTVVLAQNVTLPTEVKVKVGRMIKLKAVTPLDATGQPLYKVYWDTGMLEPGVDFDFITVGTNEVIMLFPPSLLSQSKHKFSMFMEAGNKFKIQAVIASDKNKIEIANTWVTVDGLNPVPPKPPVPPVPPVPPDPPMPLPPSALLDSLKSSLALDGDNAANVVLCQKLAAVARVVGKTISTDPTIKTTSDAVVLWKQAAQNVLAATDLPKTRAAMSAYLNAKLPTVPNQALDANTRQIYLAEYINMALALEALK